MIIPAVVARVQSFKDQMGNRYLTANENTNIIEAVLDNGQVYDIEVFSNNKKLNSLKDFLQFKAIQNIKTNKVKEMAYQFIMSGSYVDEIQKYKTKFKNEDPSQNDMALTQKATEYVAKKILYKEKLVKAGSIVRFTISFASNTLQPPIKSRSIITTQSPKGLEYSNGGIYYFSLQPNIVPIEIHAIQSKNSGIFFVPKLSSLATIQHIDFIIDHTIRTIQNILQHNNRPFLLKFDMYGNTQNNQLTQIANQLNQIYTQHRANQQLNPQMYQQYINLLMQFKNVLHQNPEYYPGISIVLPFIIQNDFMAKAISNVDADYGKSPLQMLPDTMVKLIFSKQNPDVKEKIKQHTIQYIQNIPANTIIHTTASFKKENSWGFLPNQIQTGKFTLSLKDTLSLINELNKYIPQQGGNSGN